MNGMEGNRTKKNIIYEQYERWSIEQKRKILMASSNFVQNNKHNFINYGRALLFYWNGFAVFWKSHFHLIPFILIAIVTVNFYIRIVLSATLLMPPASRLKSLLFPHISSATISTIHENISYDFPALTHVNVSVNYRLTNTVIT